VKLPLSLTARHVWHCPHHVCSKSSTRKLFLTINSRPRPHSSLQPWHPSSWLMQPSRLAFSFDHLTSALLCLGSLTSLGRLTLPPILSSRSYSDSTSTPPFPNSSGSSEGSQSTPLFPKSSGSTEGSKSSGPTDKK
jgi:hypothetical protein